MNAKFKKFFLTLATAVIVAFCTLLAACGEIGAVDQSTIKYDGSTITWGAVEDAENYTIQIDGEKEYTSSTNKFAYKVKADVEQVEITITANGKDKSGESASKIFTRLPKITEITFDEEGKMSWPEVEGANEYILKINGEELRTPALEYNEFETGVNKIQIKPIALDDSSFSEWSVEVSKEYLVAPTDVKYDGQYLTWTGIGKAARYAVYINGSLYDDNVSGTLVDYDAENNNFAVTVKALGDKVNSFDSAESQESSFVFLGEVTNFNIVDGILKWDEVDGAQGYAIRVNGKELAPVETNAFEDIEAGKEIKIEVKPITQEGTAYFASWSLEQRVKLLQAPKLEWIEDIELDGQEANFVRWNVMTGDVAGYNFKVVNPDGKVDIYDLGVGITTFGSEQNVTFSQVGTYQISIQTLAVDDTGAYDSQYCKPITVTRLAAPNRPVREFIVSDATNIKNGISIKWLPETAAAGYAIYKEDQKIRDNHENAVVNINYEQLSSVEEKDEKQINFFIQSLGTTKYFATERRISLSSLTSENLKAEVTVLAQPKEVSFQEYKAQWDGVSNANGYGVKCLADIVTTEVAEFDLENLGAGEAKLSVCAAGDGEALLASNYTSEIRIVRLQAPTQIKLVSDQDGDILDWNGGANPKATVYNVYWSGSETEFANSNEAINMRDYITEGSNTLFIRAVANKMDEDTNTYYVTSVPSAVATFTKLAAPIFNTEKVDGNNWLVWNAPTNVSGVDIRYRVYNFDTREDLIVDANRFDISDPVKYPAADYEFRVQAYSDNGMYISSDLSEKAAFTKLPKLNVTRDGDSYTWDEVPNAKEYFVKYGDKTKTLSVSETSFAPGFIDPDKTFAVEIYAVGDRINTINSESWKANQLTARVRDPEFSLSYVDADGNPATQHEAGGSIVITITYEPTATYNYEIKIGGTSRELKGIDDNRNGEGQLTYKYPVESANAYDVVVMAKGGKFEGSTYYVQSKGQNQQTITVYKAVTQLEKTTSQISWTFPDEAKFGYSIKITLKDGYTLADGNNEIVVSKWTNMKITYAELKSYAPYIEYDGAEVTKITSNMIDEVEVVVNGGTRSTGVYIASAAARI